MSDKKPTFRDPRIANLDLVQVWDESAEKFRHEHIDNISRSGVYIRTEDPYPISHKVRMVFTLVTDQGTGEPSSPNIIPVDVTGEVVRVVSSSEPEERGISGPGMGVKFIDLNPQATEIIDEIVNRRLETTPTAI